MKKILNKILIFALIFATTFSCKDPDNTVYTVTENIEYGAILRTLEIKNLNFNIFDLTSKFEVEFEEQDEEYGDLLSKVDIYVSHNNKTEGTSSSEVLAASIDASEFVLSEANKLPSTSFAITFAETLATLGLSEGDYFGGDQFVFRLELTLTDGRVFSSDDASSTLQGSYFNSPYAYTSTIICVPETPFTGVYVIDMQDSYGDGWNGASVDVTIDGTTTPYTLTSGSSGSVDVDVPDGSTELIFSFSSGDWDGEVTFQVYAPSGNLVFEGGPSPAVGPFALNLCDE
ncbi:hypothetical protein ACFQ5N_06875 [Lutibacter holmesii]|uniref:DUF4382 domain-containing protein n=1 Tax=Lutibacter holmesii TaxID=1137985 RepID=A0ABW3WN29_9FLAO